MFPKMVALSIWISDVRAAHLQHLLEDSRVFYSHTIDLVEIEPEALDRWKDNSRFGDLLLGAILRIPGYEATHLLDLAKKTTSTGTLSPELKAMRDVLVERGMGIAEAEALSKGMEEKSKEFVEKGSEVYAKA